MASAALSACGNQVAEVNAVLVVVQVVVVVAAGGSRLAGVLDSLSSAACFDRFFLHPP